MNLSDSEINVLNTEIFLHHSIADLNSSVTFYCFFLSEEVFTVKGNKYTHIRL